MLKSRVETPHRINNDASTNKVIKFANEDPSPCQTHPLNKYHLSPFQVLLRFKPSVVSIFDNRLALRYICSFPFNILLIFILQLFLNLSRNKRLALLSRFFISFFYYNLIALVIFYFFYLFK